MTNPYSLVFGKEPKQHISRILASSKIVEDFNSNNPAHQVYMLTGVRGSGKTVLMTDICKRMRQDEDWIVIELNPEKDLLQSLAAKLYSDQFLANLFRSANINLSFFGLGIDINGIAPVTDIEIALEKMFERIKKSNKKVLIAIDEVSNNEYMKIFSGSFQIFVRQELPVFLIMTGLFENIDDLQNEKNLTFLYRAPKIVMKPLSLGRIAANYSTNLNLDKSQALEMAKATQGYPFAFQVLGYLAWENNGKLELILDDYRQYLEEYVYEKIWSELSNGDKRIARAIAETPGGKIKDIRDLLNIETNQFNPYRKRLIKKGILNGEERGYVKFTLPYFDQFVLEN